MLALVVDPAAEQRISLQEASEPACTSSQALVEVRATSLNRGEVRRISGQPEGLIPGWDVAGIVLEPASDGSGPVAGTHVAAVVTGGAWAQRVAVPTTSVAILPPDISFVSAAALPLAGLTAYHALGQGGMLLGRHVLVTGAAGGVGRLAVQLAKQAGAYVTAVVGNPERGRGLRALGADDVVERFDPDGSDQDLILESVGGSSMAAALLRVAAAGTVVAFGNSSGETTTFDVTGFYGRAAGARVIGLSVFAELARTGSAARDLGVLVGLVADGSLDTGVTLELGWREAGLAFSQLLERRVEGKAVLHIE